MVTDLNTHRQDQRVDRLAELYRQQDAISHEIYALQHELMNLNRVHIEGKNVRMSIGQTTGTVITPEGKSMFIRLVRWGEIKSDVPLIQPVTTPRFTFERKST